MMRFLGLCASLAAALSLSCSPGSPVAGGTTTETTNGFTASVRTADATPAAGCRLTLRPRGFLAGISSLHPDSARTLVLDSEGRVHIDSLAAGTYALHLQMPDSSEGVFIDSLVLGGDTLRAMDTIGLQPSGLLSCRIASEGLPAGSLTLRLRGTEAAWTLPADSTIVLAGMAPGRYTLVADAGSTTILNIPVGILAGDTALLDWSLPTSLPLDAAITIDTRPAGIDLATDVPTYPLLVSLRSSRHPDSLFLREGDSSRLSFSRYGMADDLPRETAFWDSAAGDAAVWILIDTVHGNALDTCAAMHMATAASGPAPIPGVFDESYGWGGVWHFDESGGDTLKNATIMESFGELIMGDTRKPQRIAGISGGALSFSGGGEHARTDLFSGEMDLSPGLSFSAWARSDGGVVLAQIGYDTGAVGIGEALTVELGDNLTVTGNPLLSTLFIQTSTPTVTKGIWHFIAVSVDYTAGTIQLYIDGEPVASTGTSPVPGSYAGIPARATLGGSQGGQSSFTGALDEVRIFRGLFDPARVKLDYLSQRASILNISLE